MIQKKNKLIWIGNSLRDLKVFPKAVRERFGYALYVAESGGKHNHAKPLKGFKGSGVLEIVENFDKGTYRSVYTVKFKKYVYVLHCFEKKSKKGIATPKPDIEMIRARLKTALKDYQDREGVK
ncbi:type II toxin-antitoxin system RelE/ParE family toxin [Desulfococcaceae bacterium HSG7]|nr:type II toxin-antitoxin system RelE/ParE family toxin [Desulfococcaceae bacterium HSG7]